VIERQLFERQLFERGQLMRILMTFILLGVFSEFSVARSDERDAYEPLAPELRDRCLDVLRRGLHGISDKPENFWPAMHAAEALTLAGHAGEVATLLKPRLATETDHQRRCGLAREIVRAGRREPLQVLFATLADETSNGRVHAAESLYKIAEVGDGKLLRAAFAQSDNPRLQLLAAAALGRAGNAATLQRLRDSLASDDREIRKIAAWVLGLLGDAQDIEPLRKVLAAETDESVRAYFVNALACLGDADARELLGRNLSSADAAVRTYSADFASYARPMEVRAKLIRLLGDEHVDVRVRSAQALIAMSLPDSAVGLPVAAASDDVSVDVYPASNDFPRYSEGSIIPLRDGSLLYATTEFAGGGADHSGASIVARSSSDGGRTWGPQRTLQKNVGKQNVMSVTLRRLPTNGQPAPNDASPLGMFFLIKNSPTDLKVVLRVSHDEGQTFAEPIVVTPGPGYHVMNNDRVAVLSSGRLVCPVSWAADVFKNGHFVCRCFLSDDGGLTWRAASDQVDQSQRGAMEPEVVELADGRLLMIIRTQLGHIATSVSPDGGDHWSEPSKLAVEAPEAPATIRTIPSTGDLLLIWNKAFVPGAGHGGKRTPLNSAISRDGGQTWQNVRALEHNAKRGFAYTSVLFHQDRVLLSYYVHDEESGRISSRFRSLPVKWFYENAEDDQAKSSGLLRELWRSCLGVNSPTNVIVGRLDDRPRLFVQGNDSEAGQGATVEAIEMPVDELVRVRGPEVSRLPLRRAGRVAWRSSAGAGSGIGAYLQWIDVGAGEEPLVAYSTVKSDNAEQPGTVRFVRARDGGLIKELQNITHFGNNNSLVADLDGDGRNEFVYADLATLTCYELPGFEKRWQFAEGVRFCWSLPALVDTDGDGRAEIVFGSEYNNGDSNSSMLAIDGRGKQVWRSDGHAEDLGSTPVFVGDVDGDGKKELLKVGLDLEHRQKQEWNHLYVFSMDGKLKSKVELGFTGIAIGDMDGDGHLDGVGLTNTRDGGHNGRREVRCLDLATGRVKWTTPVHRAYLDTNSPVMADLNGDGKLEAVVGTGNPAGYGRLPNSEPWGDLYVVGGTGEILQHLELPGLPVNLATCDLDDDGFSEVLAVIDGIPGTLLGFHTRAPASRRDWPTPFGSAARDGTMQLQRTRPK
jgi:sialidase-1